MSRTPNWFKSERMMSMLGLIRSDYLLEKIYRRVIGFIRTTATRSSPIAPHPTLISH